MRTFDYIRAPRKWLTPDVSNLIASLHECRGKQALYLRATPDVLDTLLEIAKIQSTAASNRIEGISAADARIRALVGGSTAPRNRDEKEIAGYRDVLATIHEAHDAIPLRPGVILQLHRDLATSSAISDRGPAGTGRFPTTSSPKPTPSGAGPSGSVRRPPSRRPPPSSRSATRRTPRWRTARSTPCSCFRSSSWTSSASTRSTTATGA